MKSDSSGKTHELDTVLGALLKEQGFEHKMIEQKIFDAWEHVVGDLIARNTQPISLVKSKLTVYALSHPLVTELTLLRQHIIRKLNAEIGRAAVRELRFQMKPQSSSLRPTTQRARRSHRHNELVGNLQVAEISAGVLKKVDRTIADVADPELKTNLRHLFISQCRRSNFESPDR